MSPNECLAFLVGSMDDNFPIEPFMQAVNYITNPGLGEFPLECLETLETEIAIHDKVLERLDGQNKDIGTIALLEEKEETLTENPIGDSDCRVALNSISTETGAKIEPLINLQDQGRTVTLFAVSGEELQKE